MDIAAALSCLRPLLAEPEANLTAIRELLDQHRKDAESEVLRTVASKALRPLMERWLADPSHRKRVEALHLIRHLFSRSEAARLLRRAAIDPHHHVRRTSVTTARVLLLRDAVPPFSSRPRFSSPTRRWHDFWNWYVGSLWHISRQYQQSPAAGELTLLHQDRFPRAQQDLLAVLGIDHATLLRLKRAGDGVGSPYVTFRIAKATGGEREICAPREPLRAVQRRILGTYLNSIQVHDACHGFTRGRSVLTNARPHERAALVLKTDIEDFFPSIHYQRVKGLFLLHGASVTIAAILASLTTYRPLLPDDSVAWPSLLPQGAPTSPAIANLVCRRLDARLSGLAHRMEARYTRYADDLTFSFAKEPANIGRVFWWINSILQQEGFLENVAKRKILRRSQRQQVTGVVVNDGCHLPRDARRNFRALLANCERHGLASQARGREDFADYLQGFAAYAAMIQPELGKPWVERVRALLSQEQPG